MEMNWGAVAASAATVGVLGPAFLFAVRSIVREEIAKLNGTYVRSMGSNATGHELDIRLEDVEKRMGDSEKLAWELHSYTHRRAHELANSVQILMAMVREKND